jgi:hypothetical protein
LIGKSSTQRSDAPDHGGRRSRRKKDPGGYAVSEPEFLDEPPESSNVTDYDRRHLKLYARLLDAQASGASWEEAFRILFASAGATEPGRAQRMHAAHLKRAKWMSATGFNDLLPGSRH